MGLTISTDTLNIIGIIFSAIGVTLALFEAFVRKIHSRALDYIQWGFILAIANPAVTVPFSSQLYVGSSLIVLSEGALTSFYCPMNSYVCLRAFSLSFLVIFVGCLLLVRLITIPERVREKGFTFPRVYRFFKGLFKWFYLPLVYLSLYYLIGNVGGTVSIPAIVVLAVLLAFPIVQLILYKFFDPEGQDPFLKWLQFANYAKAALFALLIVLAVQNTSQAFLYYIAFIIVAYAGFFAVKYNFKYEIAGRVLYILGQVIFYFLYSLYCDGSTWLSVYYIDLFALGIILALDLVYLIMEAVAVYKEWKSTAGEIIPEDTKDIPTKKNRYQVEQLDGELNKNHSRDTLNESNALANSGINKTKNTKAKGTK